jgi:hypothetical protein
VFAVFGVALFDAVGFRFVAFLGVFFAFPLFFRRFVMFLCCHSVCASFGADFILLAVVRKPSGDCVWIVVVGVFDGCLDSLLAEIGARILAAVDCAGEVVVSCEFGMGPGGVVRGGLAVVANDYAVSAL